ncbi:hypothetical protein HDU79_005327 [Rhizoclosmatium sp. JEL0117]|nr:hypothetical protein HDU79_005327 [Rhizoclosmatium sp. JEL0117]
MTPTPEDIKKQLWAAAETHLSTLRTHFNAGALSASIQLLEASLLLPLAPLDALRTRIRIANTLLAASLPTNAEAHLQKAALIAASAAPPPDVRTALADAQARLLVALGNAKLAKQILHTAAQETKALDPACFLFLLSRRADIVLNENDIKATHSALQIGIDESDRFRLLDAKAVFLLRRFLLCLDSRDLHSGSALLAKHIDPLFASASSTSDSASDSPVFHLLSTYRILKLMYFLQTGDRKSAKLHLDDICKVVFPDSVSANTVLPANNSMEIDGQESINQHHSKRHTSIVQISGLLKPNQERIFVCLIVASVLKDNDNNKALEYLKHGLSGIQDALAGQPDDSDATFQDVIETRKWYVDIHVLFLHQLVEVYLLKAELVLAEETLMQLITFLHSATYTTPLLNKYLPIILLDWGLIHQSNGRLSEASRCYFGAAAVAVEVSRSSSNSGVHQIGLEAFIHETRIVASFCNVVVLLMGGDPARVEMAKQILEGLEKDVHEPILLLSSHHHQQTATSPATPMSSTISGTSTMAHCDHIKAFQNLCCAMISHSNTEIKKTNQQLKIVTLVLLGNVFLETAPGETERMVHIAYKLCKKGGVKSMGRVCASVLDEIGRRKKEAAAAAAAAAAANQ